ncbi:MFS transporter [Ornithinimicrobium sp. F0845]|uniref:MFS transporter n=1 Tax=Ornithinimicrobium sp. F0845 TaxID=2926412 RepID=UPI001FF13B5A|nr:MFS transporter [Ornithinimicrobium sp. F0845]MCK0112862.1 MFS transporter [Ornithinimicrobium sp. F0845]
MSLTSVYQRLVRADRSDQSRDEQREVAANGTRQIVAEALQATGDQVVNAKTVLPWLFAALGVPAGLTGLLVPIRESGSMLPQAALAPWVERTRRRRHLWVLGAAGQALGAASMSGAAAVLDGLVAGLVILVALAVFALARALTSLAGKDVLGRTVPKGERGQITGVTTVLSGAVAISLGVGIRLLGGDGAGAGVLAWLLAIAAVLWVLALVVFLGIREPDEEPTPGTETSGWAGRAVALLREDRTFRRFVLARTLLLVSALSPPFVVALAAQSGGGGLSGLGPFVIAQGIAGLIGGRTFGRLADRSSRDLMVWGAGAASAVIAGFLLLLLVPALREGWWLYPVTYLLLALTHTGVRVARKTYVVDLAEGDQRTEYVAVANTAMGVLLLVAGALSGGLALLGEEVALLFLGILGLGGVLVSRTLPEVSRGAT